MIDADSVDPMPEIDGQPLGGESTESDDRNDGDTENSQGGRDEATQDEDQYAIGPLPGLPHQDYGREFDAPPPSAPMDVANRIDRFFRTDAGRTLLYWRGSWVLWETTHWSELDAPEMRSHGYRSLARATYQHVTPSGIETRRWNPDHQWPSHRIQRPEFARP